MENLSLKFEVMSDREFEKISKRWSRDKRFIYFFLIASIIVLPAVHLFPLIINSSNEGRLDYFFVGSGLLVFFIILVRYFADNTRKDFIEKQKFILKTIVTRHEYKRKNIIIGSYNLQTPVPLPVDFEYSKIIFYDKMMKKQIPFYDNKSLFIIKLKNGLKYFIYEMDYVSIGTGEFLELHIAKNSGLVLSVRKITNEISKTDLMKYRKTFTAKSQRIVPNPSLEDLDKPDFL